MKREQVLMHLVRAEADFVRGLEELTKLREALQADIREEQSTAPEDFRVEEPDVFTRRPDPPQPEIAATFGDMVTAKQLGLIRAIARELGIDAEAECESFYSCKTADLSKRAASGFIDHLNALKRQGRVSA